MFKRSISTIMPLYKKFPAIAILGPRQSGKTTLAQSMFPKHIFISFEIPANRMLATPKTQSASCFHKKINMALFWTNFSMFPSYFPTFKSISMQKKGITISFSPDHKIF